MTATPVSTSPSPDVRCPLCGFDYVPGGDTCKEKGCPVAFGGCATRHCPRCGYTMPDEERSPSARFVRMLFGGRARRAGTLADLPAGATAVLDRLEATRAFSPASPPGPRPGVEIHVLQRTPTHVIEVGHTTIAVERRVAEAILVR